MEKTNSFSGHFEIRVSLTSGDDKKLRDDVRSALKDIYGAPLPETVEKRLEAELGVSERFGYAPVFLAHQRIIRCAEALGYPFYLLGSNGASLICSALGISELNPLPAHYRCASCGRSRFIADGFCDDGFSLPDAVCPICGGTMKGYGSNLALESFLGYHGDRLPHLGIGVPSGKAADAAAFFGKTLGAERTDPRSIDVRTENGFAAVLFDLVPVDGLFSDGETYPIAEMNDPVVFGFLSQPESSGCYMPYGPNIPLAKELLGSVRIDGFSDLFRVCGLIHSVGWIGFVLPCLKSGRVNLRRTVTSREDIFRLLTSRGIGRETAYRVMETARKGRAAKLFDDEDTLGLLLAHGITEKNIVDLENIGYLPTDAQARELAVTAYRNARHRLHV